MAEDFGTRLKALREQKGLSQKDLGSRINKNANAIWRYEKNLQQPSLDVLQTFSAVFGVPLSYWDSGERGEGLTEKQRTILYKLQSDMKNLQNLSKGERAIRWMEIEKQLLEEYLNE